MPEHDDPQRRVTAYWDIRAPSYDAEPGHGLSGGAERAAWVEDLSRLLPPIPCDVLDVGTGTGFLAFLLAEMGHRVRGIDLSGAMLARARKRARRLVTPPTFDSGDAVAPPCPPASVDVVISRHLLWTLPDPAKALAAWLDILRPGGRVVIIDGLWFPGGRDVNAIPTEGAWQRAWHEHYTATLRARLPLMEIETLEPVVALVMSAGFEGVAVSSLPTVEAFERGRGAIGGAREPRYVVTGRKP